MTPRLSGHFFNILVWFSFCSSLLWKLRDNQEFVKNLEFCPKSLVVVLECKYIERVRAIALTALLTTRSLQLRWFKGPQ